MPGSTLIPVFVQTFLLGAPLRDPTTGPSWHWYDAGSSSQYTQLLWATNTGSEVGASIGIDGTPALYSSTPEVSAVYTDWVLNGTPSARDFLQPEASAGKVILDYYVQFGGDGYENSYVALYSAASLNYWDLWSSIQPYGLVLRWQLEWKEPLGDGSFNITDAYPDEDYEIGARGSWRGDGLWHHIRLELQAGTITAWTPGVFVSDMDYTGGSLAVSSDGYIKGWIDDVLVYDIPNRPIILNFDGQSAAEESAGSWTPASRGTEAFVNRVSLLETAIANGSATLDNLQAGYFGAEDPEPDPVVEHTFSPDADVTGETIGLTWVEQRLADGSLKVSAKMPLPDPSTYYGGYKEGRVTSWNRIRRALSAKDGSFERISFSWTLSDVDRVWRGILADAVNGNLLNRAVVIRMISDAARRAGDYARTIVRGVVRRYRAAPGLTFEITAEDALSQQFTATVPKRLLSRTQFADLPSAAVGKAEPIIYGAMSDEGSSGAAPILTGTAALGAYLDAGAGALWVFGFGGLTSGAAAPTNVICAAAAGGALSLDVPEGEYGVMVSSVDSDGVESDPCPYYIDRSGGGGRGSFDPAVPHAAVTAGNQTINVSWTAAAGAVKYRAYLGYYYYGFRPMQCLEVAGTSCSFNAGPAWNETATPDNTTSGALLTSWGVQAQYAVSAVMSDGETSLSLEGIGVCRGYRRPVRVEWLAVAGALSYRVYRRAPGSDWDRMWTVAAGTLSLDDDWLDSTCSFVTGSAAASGLVPVRWVGMETIDGYPWYAFLVAGHACKSVLACYQAKTRVNAGCYGLTWLVPGQAGWPWGSTLYRDIAGRRYTILYVRGPDGFDASEGTRPITVNVQGIEDVGDGSGALIESLPLQYLHFLQNFGTGDWQSGAWLASPTFPADPAPESADTLKQIDEASFATAKTISEWRVSGGYLGATIIGANDEILPLRDVLARWNLSCDCDSGWNRKSQYFVTMEDDRPATLAAAPSLTQNREILKDSFETEDQDTELFNARPYAYGYRPVTSDWAVTGTIQDADSIASLGETRTAAQLELRMVPASRVAVASDILQRQLARTGMMPRRVSWSMTLAGLSHELGDVVRLTHTDGIGLLGWAEHPVRVTSHEVNPEDFTVALEGRDLGYLEDAS